MWDKSIVVTADYPITHHWISVTAGAHLLPQRAFRGSFGRSLAAVLSSHSIRRHVATLRLEALEKSWTLQARQIFVGYTARDLIGEADKYSRLSHSHLALLALPSHPRTSALSASCLHKLAVYKYRGVHNDGIEKSRAACAVHAYADWRRSADREQETQHITREGVAATSLQFGRIGY